MSINDNGPDTPEQRLRALDPQGQAAVILGESLIHGLIAKSVLTAEDSLDIVMAAAEVQTDYTADDGDAAARTRQSLRFSAASPHRWAPRLDLLPARQSAP